MQIREKSSYFFWGEALGGDLRGLNGMTQGVGCLLLGLRATSAKRSARVGVFAVITVSYGSLFSVFRTS